MAWAGRALIFGPLPWGGSLLLGRWVLGVALPVALCPCCLLAVAGRRPGWGGSLALGGWLPVATLLVVVPCCPVARWL